jgi:hypothetical protein
MDAAPEASYVGIDSGHMGLERGFDFLADVQSKMQGRNATIQRIDSLKVPGLPLYDFIHIDGNHLIDWAYHDMIIALQSRTRWILCDDARDAQVTAGIFRAVLDYRHGPMEWAYFEDTWTGSILFCQDIAR